MSSSWSRPHSALLTGCTGWEHAQGFVWVSVSWGLLAGWRSALAGVWRREAWGAGWIERLQPQFPRVALSVLWAPQVTAGSLSGASRGPGRSFPEGCMCHQQAQGGLWMMLQSVSTPQGPAAVGQGRQGAWGAEQSLSCISHSLAPLLSHAFLWALPPPFQQGLAN